MIFTNHSFVLLPVQCRLSMSAENETDERVSKTIKFREPLADFAKSTDIQTSFQQTNSDGNTDGSSSNGSFDADRTDPSKKTFPDFSPSDFQPVECARECNSFGFYMELEMKEELMNLTKDQFYWCMYEGVKKQFFITGDKVMIDNKEATILYFSVDDLDQSYMFYTRQDLSKIDAKNLSISVCRPSTVLMSNTFQITYHIQNEDSFAGK